MTELKKHLLVRRLKDVLKRELELMKEKRDIVETLSKYM